VTSLSASPRFMLLMMMASVFDFMVFRIWGQFRFYYSILRMRTSIPSAPLKARPAWRYRWRRNDMGRDLRLDHLRCIGCHLRRHGIREIHRQERNVDVFELLHFRDISVSPAIYTTFIAKGQDVTVPSAPGMERLSGLALWTRL